MTNNMTDMKKTLVFAAFALIAAGACNKNAENQQSSEIVLETPVPVCFSTNLKNVQITKGAGPLEDTWSEQEDIHIFGIQQVDGSGLVYETPFIYDVVAKAKNGQSIELINPAVVDPENPEYTEPFYYGNEVYDFFGYYVDDAVEEDVATLGENGYYVHAVIDGTQDLMVACAAKENNANVSPARVFSAYAARRGVQPHLLFKHKLARFNFFLRSGSDAYDKVSIAKIELESNTEADMLVAAPGADEAPLFNIDNRQLLTLNYIENPLRWEAPAEPGAQPADIEAGSLMVIPGDEVYKLQLQLLQEGATTDEGNMRYLSIDFSQASFTGGIEEQQAMPGYEYNVTIVVYSLERVEVSVSIAQWNDGGSTIIDSDAE